MNKLRFNITSMRKLPISVIILTYNEEKNIDECLKSIHGWVEEIFIVDSYSNDFTLKIASKYTDNIFQHTFENQAKQLNWALDNLPIKTEWIMRMDADEKVTSGLQNELSDKLLSLNQDITGLYVKRRVYFMGKWIKHGGYYPTWLLRIWRKDKAFSEERWMDEHMRLIDGSVSFLECDIIDDNKKSLHWWIGKHNSYATREAIDIMNLKHGFFKDENIKPRLSGTQEQRKRWIKENIYMKMPLFVRPFLYFIYRYIIQLGFLDGKEGLIWHFLQGFWYRFLVDAKIYEIRKNMRTQNRDAEYVINDLYGIQLNEEKNVGKEAKEQSLIAKK